VIFVEKPLGVVIVAAFTLLGAIVWGYIILLGVTLPNSLGESGWPPLTFNNLPFYLLLVFWLLSFVFLVLLASPIRSRFLWYSLIAYWIVLFVYFVWVYYPYYLLLEMPPFYVSMLLLSPFAYVIGSLTYFLTKKPREYFNIKK
jgi:hypothetical protein